MPDVIEQLRSELRVVAAGRPADEPSAFPRIVRRAARRRVTTRVGAVAGLVAMFAVVVGAPRFLHASIGGSHLARPVDTAQGPREPGCAPEPAADRSGGACAPGGFEVTPTVAAAGSTVAVSGSCGTALRGRASTVTVLLSLKASRRYTGTVGPDGRFALALELPLRLLPARYQLTVSCAIDGRGRDVTGVALLGDRAIDVARPATTTKPGVPEPGTLSAAIGYDSQGTELRLKGGGCYLPALGGALGLVRIAFAPAGANGPGDPGSMPATWSDSVVVEPGPDGAWRALVRSSARMERMTSYDIYAFCTDDLGGLGFMYQAVYRYDLGRLERVEAPAV
jgi:hypothetical protein